MAIIFKPRKSTLAGAVPTTSQLQDGELAVNTTDKKIFIRVGAAIVEMFKNLTKADVGLSNVDNTSDANKPVSTATATALAAKANTTHNHSISNVTGLQTALDGKQAAGSYAPASHTHTIANVSGLQDALTARPPLVIDGDWLSISGAYVSVSTIFDAANSPFRWTAPSDYTNIVSFPSKDADSGLALATTFGSGNRFWLRGRHNTRGPTAWERWKPWMEIALNGTDVWFLAVKTAGPNGIQIGAATNASEGYISYYTAGDGTTRTAYMGYGSAGATDFAISNERGGSLVVSSAWLNVVDGGGHGLSLRPSGEVWLGDANNRANRRRQPRTFVQSADPGAAAADGDLWIW